MCAFRDAAMGRHLLFDKCPPQWMIIINNMLQSGKTSRKTVPTVSQHHAGACVSFHFTFSTLWALRQGRYRCGCRAGWWQLLRWLKPTPHGDKPPSAGDRGREQPAFTRQLQPSVRLHLHLHSARLSSYTQVSWVGIHRCAFMAPFPRVFFI